jgi:prepilin signal peptidase PulO-like enzyme (type II secretory pathway)
MELLEIDWLGSPRFQDHALTGALWWFLVLWFGAVGGCVGSFFNVCWDRRGTGRGIVFPPSQCDACGHTIRWYDNIPVFGWLLLGGRCRDCGSRFPVKHLLVEATFALVFMALGVVILSSGLVSRLL